MITWLGVKLVDPFTVYWSSENPLAFLLVLPCLLYTVALLAPALYLGARARSSLKKAFREGVMVSASGATGATVASAVLAAQGATDVPVVQNNRPPREHYEPELRLLRLSSAVYNGRSLFAIGIAAFEASRAGAPRSWIRDPLVLALLLARETACLLMLAALVANYYKLVFLGVTAYSGIAVLALMLLPKEGCQANRALLALTEAGLLTPDELDVVRKVLAVAPWKLFVPLLPDRVTFPGKSKVSD
jgi:Zn-dependent membrane protease YugP